MKTLLHQPPPEIRLALAMRPEKRARKRNEHSKSDNYDRYLEKTTDVLWRRANRRAHRVPLS